MYITGGRRMEPCWHQSWHWQAELSLSPSLSSGKLNSITHSRDREKQKTQSSEENPLPSARRLHMSPSTSVRLFFFFFFFCYPILSYKSKKKRRRFRNPHRVLSWNSLFLQWRWMAYSTLSRSISFQGIYLWRYLCEGSDKRGTNFSVCVVVFGWWWFFRTLVLWYFRRRAQLSPPSTHQPTIDEEEAEEEPSMEFYYQDIPSLFTRQVIFTSPICSNKCVCGYIWKGNRLLLAVGAMMIGPPSLLCLRLSRPYFIKTAQWRDKKDPCASPPTRLPLECCEIVLHRKKTIQIANHQTSPDC